MNWARGPKAQLLGGLLSGRADCIFAPSVFLGYKLSSFERSLIIIRPLHRALGKLYLLALHFLVGNETQDVPNAVEPRPLLVIRTQDVPRRPFGVRGLEHQVPGARILEPLAAR